jgi:hypothetical protein
METEMMQANTVAVQAIIALVGVLGGALPAAASVDFSTAAVQVTQVAPGDYAFVETGFSEGAEITGSFSGTDLNSDGQLSYFTNPPDPSYPLEIINFSLSFSGNSLVPAFSLDFAQLDNFNYQLGSTLGATSAAVNGLQEGIEAGSPNRFYIVGPGPAALCNGVNACGGVMAVPEPATWTVMLGGLAAVGGALRAARRERAALQKGFGVSVAETEPFTRRLVAE